MLFDASLLRTQLRASEDLRAEGIPVPLASDSKDLQDGLSSYPPQWRSDGGFHNHSQVFTTIENMGAIGNSNYMKLVAPGGPCPGMVRVANQGPIGVQPDIASSSFRATLPLVRNSFAGRDYRVEDEAVSLAESRPPLPMTTLLTELQKETGLDAPTVNELYLKQRIWAPATVEYKNMGPSVESI